VVLGGDFRQILPVIEGGTRSQIVNAAIINSPLWSYVTILQLTQNMRLSTPNVIEEEESKIAEFSTWLLDIGYGNIKAIAKEKEEEPCWITNPHEYLLLPEYDKISCIVNTTFFDLHTNYADAQYIKDRAILTPTNNVADTINSHIVSVIPGEAKQYLSSNRIVKAPNTHDPYDLLYPIEFLHTLNANNFLHHELILKKGVPVMLLRNINQSEGPCNGTRLIITALGDMVIEGQLITETYQGKKFLYHRYLSH
jgi:ATP-dependent DNA helicase PIF1